METTNTTETPQAAESKWYVLRVVSGKESKVKEYLDKEFHVADGIRLLSRFFCQWKKYIKCKMVKR